MSPVPWQRLASVVFTADVTLTLATEVVVTTLPAISLDGASQRVELNGWFQASTGVGATTITVRIRRGTTVSGTLVGEANAVTTAASSTVLLTHEVEDSPGDVAGQQYVLTAVAAGAAGTALQGALLALIV